MALVTVQRSPTSSSSRNKEESNTIEDGMDKSRKSKSLSECYFAGKGAALVLAEGAAKGRGVGAAPAAAVDGTNVDDANAEGVGGGVNVVCEGSAIEGRFAQSATQTGGGRFGAAPTANSTIQRHLQSMFYLLRPEETLKMAVKLESVHPNRTRYLVVVSRMGHRSEESCLLGIDCNEKTTVGLVLKVLANTKITLDGDGGFSVSVSDRHHIFKPVSVQAMWSALQTLHKVSAKARENNYFESKMTHGWVEYYENRIESDRSCLNEWHAMDNLESKRPPSPDSIRTKPTEREETERVIRTTLKEIMMSVDLDEVTSKFIRSRLEEELDMDLGEYKSFIDQEMLVILGQMDAPTKIFDHVYLGSEWNASNYEELQRNGVGHILNVTREIDNFFPGTFDYLNIRVYDDEKTDLLKHWDDTFKYITKAKDKGSKVLVHCKMGVSRSASVVIAYAMKAYNWNFHTALEHVKEKRSCIKPNTSFLTQLETYQGILDAMKNKEKLQRSKSETNLKSPANVNKLETAPGTKLTPVQVLSKSYDSQKTMSGQDLRDMGARPKSWSPDNLTTREVCSSIKCTTTSMSLEDLSQKSSSKESIKSVQTSQEVKSSLARHVLMPCDNGESYSVSPNQIVHLPGHDSSTSHRCERKNVVLNLASRFEGTPEAKNLDVLDVAASDDSSSSNLSSRLECKVVNRQTNNIKGESWDPGETQPRQNSGCYSDSTSATCDLKTSLSESQTVWTSSMVIKTQTSVPTSSNNLDRVPESLTLGRPKNFQTRKDSDPFSNHCDRVFDREERRQQRQSTIPIIPSGYIPELAADERNPRECPSRQSSWSSYDSAVVIGSSENTELSRHSSWGSGDTRNIPSRNSSWGSYDVRPQNSTQNSNEKEEKLNQNNTELSDGNTVNPYDKEEIPWNPGTVKRTKQKIENIANTISNCTSAMKAGSTENVFKPNLESFRPPEAINKALIESGKVIKDTASSAISDTIDIIENEAKSISSYRLSISAPEPSSMRLVTRESSLSRSTSNVAFIGTLSKEISSSVISTAQCSSVKQHKTYLENLSKDNLQRKVGEAADGGNSSGKVRNLKKEFEAKSSTNTEAAAVNDVNEPSRGVKTKESSLPSSPVTLHLSKDQKQNTSEDLNFKSLIGIFESNKEESLQSNHVNLRHKQCINKPFISNGNVRHSCCEVLADKNPVRIAQTPLISSLSKNSETIERKEDLKPPTVPILRDSPRLMVAATVIASAAKKQQQYGKSHPLARLNIKPRHNNPVYNTM